MIRLRRASFTAHVMPPRSWAERIGFGGLVGLALLLLVMGRTDMGLFDRLSHGLRDTLLPVMTLAAQPAAAFHDSLDWVGEQFALAEENRRLRAQVDRLLAWRAEATRLEVENASLRDVLHAQRQQPVPITSTARVVADSRSPFVHTRLLDGGVRHGVADGMAALGVGGVAGRVIDTAGASSRLLLITDLNSRLPVLVLPSRDPAILTGDNGPRPRLDFLPLTPQVAVGDRVVTSGAAGVLPVGLPVGRVVDTGDGTWRVLPGVDWEDLQQVRLVQAAAPQDPSATAPGGR